MTTYTAGTEWGACPTCGVHTLLPVGRPCDQCDPLIPLARWCSLHSVPVRRAYDWVRLGHLQRIAIGGSNWVPREQAVPATKMGRPRA